MRKILCLIMSVSILAGIFGVFAPTASADDIRDTYTTSYPTVYVGGQGAQIVDEQGNEVYPIDYKSKIGDSASDLLPVYKDALLSQNWDEFLDEVYEIFHPLISQYALDKNGDATNGTHVNWSWSKSELNSNKINGGYPLYRYYFHYDWRLDPFVLARQLHDYIEGVLEVTGEEKVELIGRCLGASVANAYLYLYDGEYIDSYLQYASSAQGALVIEKMYSGQLGFDADLLENYIIDNYLGLEGDVYEIAVSVATVLNKTYGLDLICNAFNKTYDQIFMDIMPRLLGDTYATFPGFWSMVSDNDNCYETAKKVLLYSNGYTADSPLVKRIDDYHYNVQNKVAELFDRMQNVKNIHISNITKYGYSPRPFLKNCDVVSDDTCSVTASSNGAKASTIKGFLSPFYLLKAKITGKTKYISPDRKIDASTCLCPDSTWFIKDLLHPDFPDFIEGFMAKILNDNEITIDSYDEYPQYLHYNEDQERLEKLSEDNMKNDYRYYTSFTAAFIKLIKYIPTIIAMIRKGN